MRKIEKNKLPFLISLFLTLGGIVMALFMCVYVDFGLNSTVGKLAVYIAFCLQAVNVLLVRLRMHRLIKEGAPAPSEKMRRFHRIFSWIWRLGAVLLLLSLLLILCGMEKSDPWVRYTCLAGVCLLPVGWLGILAAFRRRDQAAMMKRKSEA